MFWKAEMFLFVMSVNHFKCFTQKAIASKKLCFFWDKSTFSFKIRYRVQISSDLQTVCRFRALSQYPRSSAFDGACLAR